MVSRTFMGQGEVVRNARGGTGRKSGELRHAICPGKKKSRIYGCARGSQLTSLPPPSTLRIVVESYIFHL